MDIKAFWNDIIIQNRFTLPSYFCEDAVICWHCTNEKFTVDEYIRANCETQLSGYSYSMFSRLFSILTETTLSEYLRSRRLTEAAVILRDTDEKIIDLAFKFGYESSVSFGTAFRNFHGFTPSEVRNGKPFKLVSRVQLALSVSAGRSLKKEAGD